MAQIRPHQQQNASISTQVKRMVCSPSLEESLKSWELLFQRLLGSSQWAICYEGRGQFSESECFSFSKSESFAQLCQETYKSYRTLTQPASPISLPIEGSCLSIDCQKQLLAAHFSSLLFIPLLDDQSYLGTLCVGQPDKQDDWREEDLNTLKALSQQIVLILRQKEQLERYQKQQQQQQLLQAIYHHFNSEGVDSFPWENILSQIGQFFQVEQVVLLRFCADKAVLEQEWRLNPDIAPWQSIEDLELSCKLKSYQYTNYTLEINRNNHSQPNVALSVSLKSQEHCFGRLILQTLDPERRFSTEEIRFLEMIGDIMAVFGVYNLFSQELRQINQRNNAKGEFLSYMTHELRTPLTGILGFAKMLSKELYGELNEKQKEYVRGIVSSGEHLLSLVNDFLDFSKLEAQKEELVFEPMVVEELCQSALVIVQGKANEQGVDLILNINDSVDICVADKRKLKQILLNLLSNALKFTEEGSVTLEVKKEQKYLLFSVIDTGIGIKSEDQERLFEPFEQIKTPLGQKHKGTGLGLTISRQLAILHGGDLTCQSNEGKGSCFTLSLPIDN